MGDKDKSRSGLAVSSMSKKSLHGIASSKTLQSKAKLRRPSYGFGSVPGIRPVERTSNLGIEFKRPPLMYLPTFQLEPKVRFDTAIVQKYAESVADEHYIGHKYNPQLSPELALKVAGEIMRGVKAMNFNRYRVIVVATLGQKRAQSYNNCITFVWDHNFDDYVDIHRENHTSFLQITVFGVYLD